MAVSLFYNPTCPDCVRQAATTARMDWLARVELRTDDSPLGQVPVGEIVVVEHQSGKTFTGVYATRKVCLQVPCSSSTASRSTFPRCVPCSGATSRAATATPARSEDPAIAQAAPAASFASIIRRATQR